MIFLSSEKFLISQMRLVELIEVSIMIRYEERSMSKLRIWTPSAVGGKWPCGKLNLSGIVPYHKHYPTYKPWKPTKLWDVQAPTFSRHSTQRWRWRCQPYRPAALYPEYRIWDVQPVLPSRRKLIWRHPCESIKTSTTSRVVDLQYRHALLLVACAGAVITEINEAPSHDHVSISKSLSFTALLRAFHASLIT
jgi:hypothetical protein